MTSLASMERVYDRVRLVRGKGARRKGQLCVMSFVALLAGERHTDAPETASPFIRNFAIVLNDAMPDLQRQCLKPFAPRILRTNDGQDAVRARLARRMLAEEVIPRLQADLGAAWLPRRLGSDWPAYVAEGTRSPQECLFTFIGDAGSNPADHEVNEAARTAARLLITCARSACSQAEGAWYWSKAVDLLDRLCDVGPPTAGPPVSPAQVADLECLLDRKGPLERAALIASEVVQRVRGRLGDPVASPGSKHGRPADAAGSADPAPVVAGAAMRPAPLARRAHTVI